MQTGNTATSTSIRQTFRTEIYQEIQHQRIGWSKTQVDSHSYILRDVQIDTQTDIWRNRTVTNIDKTDIKCR